MSDGSKEKWSWATRICLSLVGMIIAGIVGTLGWEKYQQIVPQPSYDETGQLWPGTQDSIDNVCVRRGVELPKGTVVIVVGNNAITVSEPGRRVKVLRVFEEDRLELELTPSGGLNIYAVVRNRDGKEVVKFDGPRKYTVNPMYGPPRKTKRQDQLIVDDGNKGELFRIRYLNPTTVQVEGIFPTVGHPNVVVTRHKISFASALKAAGGNCSNARGFAMGQSVPSPNELAYLNQHKFLSYTGVNGTDDRPEE